MRDDDRSPGQYRLSRTGELPTNRALDYGAPTAPLDGEYQLGFDPTTGAPAIEVAQGSSKDVDAAVAAAIAAASEWRRLASAVRGRLMSGLAAEIRANADHLIALERADTGKPEGTARAEIEGSAEYFEFYGGLVNLPIGDVLERRAEPARLHPTGAVRRNRHHHPVEPATEPGRASGRARAGGRKRCGHEAL